MASASGYNHHRFARSVLKKSRKWEASLTVELHSGHWKFNNSPMNFPYDHPLRPFLLALRSQVIPAALLPFLYEIQPPIAFVDGCLVVQVNDHRRSLEPTQTRVVMRPAAEGLAQTIDLVMQQKGEMWDEQFALEAEARIINTTTAPLYLGTSPLASRNANLALSLTSPAHSSLSADGRVRDPHRADSGASDLDLGVGSSADRMRALLRATDRPIMRQGPAADAAAVGSGAPAAFTPSWLVYRAQRRYQDAKEKAIADQRAGLQPNAAAALAAQAGAGGPAGGIMATSVLPHASVPGASEINSAEGGQPDASAPTGPTPSKPKAKPKKKRPALDDDAPADAPTATVPAPAQPAAPKKKKSAATKKAEIAAAQAAQQAADEAAANGTVLPSGMAGAGQPADVKPSVGAQTGGDEKPKGKGKKKRPAKVEQ